MRERFLKSAKHEPTTVMSAPYFFARAVVVAAACRAKFKLTAEIVSERFYPLGKVIYKQMAKRERDIH